MMTRVHEAPDSELARRSCARLLAMIRTSGLVSDLSQGKRLMDAGYSPGTVLHVLGEQEGLDPEILDSLARLAEYVSVDGRPELGVPLRIASARVVPEIAGARTVDDGRKQMLSSRYEVKSLLGRGGMGEVWLARDLELGRAVAVKFLRAELMQSATSRRRFAEEAQLMALLAHPVIPPIHDCGINPDGLPFFVLRLVDNGKDLHDVLSMARPVQRRLLESGKPPSSPGSNRPWSDAHLASSFRRIDLIAIVRQVALCVASAHARGILHRDIKPGNIMIGARGEPLLLDWGLSRAIGITDSRADSWLPTPLQLSLPPSHGRALQSRPQQRGDMTHGPLGTPGFASPEQTRGERLDERADVYSLGAVLYQVLTYELPFGGVRRFDEELARLQAHGPVPPSERTPWARIPPSIEAICLKAMSARPQDRHPTAMEFAHELSAFLEGRLEAERKKSAVKLAVDRARAAIEERHRCLELLPAIERAAQRLEVETPRDWSLVRKRQLFEAQDRVADMKRLAAEKLDEAVESYLAALDDDPESTDISLELAELAWSQFQALDEVDNPSPRDVFHWRSLVKAHGCGFYDARLLGNGALRVDSQVPGATATLYWVKPGGAMLERRNPHVLGKTPTRAVSLPMGSYDVIVELEGRPPLHYPVRLRRSEVVCLNAHLHTQAEIGEGYVFVPPGPAILGGDPELPRYRKRAREVRDLPGFFIKRTHVTCADYLEFLQDLPPELAIARAPRDSSSDPYWIPDARGRWHLPEGRAPFCGLPWHSEWPIVSVSFEDALAYAEWRSKREGRRLDLPSSDQWEKAARGVDGRYFPWGNHFDSSLCNLPAAGSSGAAPAPVGSYPGDRSPYGVLDLAGNALDLVYLGDLEEEERLCGARGGGWHVRNLLTRSAAVTQIRIEDRHPFLSFRLVATPAEGWEI